MIDFNYTAELTKTVQYLNERGEVVKTYPLSELYDYVVNHKEYPNELEFKPLTIHKDWYGRYNDFCVDTYIDNNWIELTKEFYNFKNK